MSYSMAAAVVFAQAIPQERSLAGWMIAALMTFSFSSLLVLISGVLIFGGACYLVATRRRPAVLAACLVLLPLPVFFAFYGVISGMVASLVVIASSPGISLTTEALAEGTAASLVEIMFAMLVSAPSYFVLSFGLLARTLGSSGGSTPSTAVGSESRQRLFNASGPKPATT